MENVPNLYPLSFFLTGFETMLPHGILDDKENTMARTQKYSFLFFNIWTKEFVFNLVKKLKMTKLFKKGDKADIFGRLKEEKTVRE